VHAQVGEDVGDLVRLGDAQAGDGVLGQPGDLALAAEPSLLLLDEPTAGMSPEETDETMSLIRELAVGRTVILVEHKMKVVMKISDRITVLHQGQVLAEGTPEEIRANDRVQKTYLGAIR